MRELEFLPAWYPALRQRRRALRRRAAWLAGLMALLLCVGLAAALAARRASTVPTATPGAGHGYATMAMLALVTAAAAGAAWIWTRHNLHQADRHSHRHGRWVRARRAEHPPRSRQDRTTATANPRNPQPATPKPRDPQPEIATLLALGQSSALQNMHCRPTHGGAAAGRSSTLALTFSSRPSALAAFLVSLEQARPAWKVRGLRADASPSASPMLQVHLTVDLQTHAPLNRSAP